VCGVYALWRAYGIFYVVAFTGYTGPGESPSAEDSYLWAAAGGLLNLLFIALSFRAFSVGFEGLAECHEEVRMRERPRCPRIAIDREV
jgi:hypothetical protein